MPYTDKSLEASFIQLRETQERAEALKNYSKQKKLSSDTLFTSLWNWSKVHLSERNKFDYQPDSRQRDTWLRSLWKREPHIAGVLNSVIAIDKNRNWTLTGTKRQVVLYNNILRYADDNLGWREFVSVSAENFYSTDMGTVVEIGRQGRVGPMRGIYNVDSAKVRLTGDRNYPIEYFHDGGQSQKWYWSDFFRQTSMPSGDDRFHRLGYCAVSRAVELIMLLLSVYEYDQEMLLAKAPKGLLLLHNIGEQQWEDALAARREKMAAMGQEYFSGVIVLAQEGMDQIDAKLVGLSQLPSGFDREVVTNQIMYGLSLIFGYPPDEFWPVQYGALGRGRETEIHYMRAISKGGGDYTLGIQDKLQQEMPDTVVFEFDKRDPETDMAEAEMQLAWAKVADLLYNKGEGTMDREEVRSILASKGVINSEMTAALEATVATGSGIVRGTKLRLLQEQYRDTLAVMRAADFYPKEPIIRIHYPSGIIETIFDRGDDFYNRTLWSTADITSISQPALLTKRKTNELVGETEPIGEPIPEATGFSANGASYSQ
mgnify:CR=1 FL=1